jgi:hypothetical protein
VLGDRRYAYRGDTTRGLRGWYVFGDYCGGAILGLPADAARTAVPRARAVLLDTHLQISTLGQDPDGELYVADLVTGAIYRIVAP